MLTVVKGIDISSHQGDIDFQKVKAAGYSYVIIKAGQGLRQMDTFRKKYLPAVLAAGLDWGAYWWSDAVTVPEAKQEAQAFLKALNGLKPTYPVYMDQEYEDINSLAMDLLQDYKLNFKRVFALLIIVLILWAATIVGFVWYLNQYDFVSSIESTAVYSIIDSSGNVISSDIPQDQLERILELISNGKDKSPKG